jgi:hypothetical protein
MNLSIVSIILGLVVTHGADIAAIEKATGGFAGIVSIGQQLKSGSADVQSQKGAQP